MSEQFNYRGYTITIEQDMDPCSPRHEYDHLGTMALYHKRYDLADKDAPTMEESQEIAESKEYYSLPVYMYDHSGYTISCKPFSSPWDSGQLGIVFVSKEKADKEGITEEKALEYLKGEVKVYDQYLTGDVWGYVITHPVTGEEKSSCWGFYGHETAEDEAKRVIDCYKPEAEFPPNEFNL